jgi:Spermine/spermidine synthase domain
VSAGPAPGEREDRGSRLRLVLLSFLMLFVELGLIRYTAAYVVYLAYFTNFVLLASFLGVGVGFLRARASRDLFAYAPVTLLAVVLFVAAFPVSVGRVGDARVFQGSFGLPPLPQWISLPVIFVLSFAVMALIAEGVARTFARFEALEAYRLDISGSILGVGSFSALSFLHAPPLAWGGVVVVLSMFLIPASTRLKQAVPFAALLAVLAVMSFAPRTHWSPYYRVHTSPQAEDGTMAIRVNGLPHQWITPLDDLEADQPFRFDLYRHAPDNPLRNVLIVGSGGGNDVTIALSRGAGHIDAVEIDPVLQGLGRDLHPNHPYQDPRVRVIIQDGRAFLHDAEQRYDLVLFALPDSHTLIAGQASLRLESYLFTLEAMEEVREHLTPEGVFVMYHYYLPSVTDRYAGTMQKVFGHTPCVDKRVRVGLRRQTVLTVGMSADSITCDTPWRPAGLVPEPDADDHPFPYLATRTIPGRYLVSLFVILLGSGFVVRLSAGPMGRMRSYLDLFFMGAAFLLLETKNVVQFALLFGTTWFVNALVFAGILVTVLVAIEVARRVRLRRPAWLYAPLLGSLALAWAIPPDALLGLSFLPRFLAAAGLAFAPVFLANLVFAERFRGVGSSTVAFGANLLGAMVGGVLEYSALVIGYRALLLVVALLYILALTSGRRYLVGGRSDAGPARRIEAAGAAARGSFSL